MAEITNTTVLGQQLRAFTEAQLAEFAGYAKALGYVPIAEAVRHPSSHLFITVPLLEDANNNTVESIPFRVPYPVKCWAIDVGCKSAAGATATLDIQRKPVGGAFASVLDAPEDIKTGANAFQRVAPEVDSELWDFDDEVKAVVVGGGAGVVVGAMAVLLLQRR